MLAALLTAKHATDAKRADGGVTAMPRVVFRDVFGRRGGPPRVTMRICHGQSVSLIVYTQIKLGANKMLAGERVDNLHAAMYVNSRERSRVHLPRCAWPGSLTT